MLNFLQTRAKIFATDKNLKTSEGVADIFRAVLDALESLPAPASPRVAFLGAGGNLLAVEVEAVALLAPV